MKVTDGSIVTFHYTILDDNDEVVETSKTEGPVSAIWGDGDLLIGVEKALEGAEAGATMKLNLAPEEAFGDYDPEGIFSVPRSEIPTADNLNPGEWISILLEPEEDDQSGIEEEEHEARVVSMDDEEVILDANHPLAGKSVVFELEVLEVSSEG